MRFVLKKVGNNRERIGTLLFKPSGACLETPTAALFTQGGCISHLTHDVLEKVFRNPHMLWIPLSNSYHLEVGLKATNQSLAKFIGLKENLTCITLHSMNDIQPKGHFELEEVPLWTIRGKLMLNANKYMDLMEVFKPSMILALADGKLSLDEANKRVNKSVFRTTTMLDVCVDRHKKSKKLQESALIGVIVGAGDERKCEECIQHILKHKDSLSGISLQGLIDGAQESINTAATKLESILNRVHKCLPVNHLRILEGGWNPVSVMTAIHNGWDLFDGTYPLNLTNKGHALTLDFDITRNTSSSGAALLDLNDERYKEDFVPVLDGCECLTCQNHTRAYIRHLLNCKEMLAQVLLNIHNLHHFDQMFHHARQHIAAETFHVFRKHITYQYESYAAEADKLPTEVQKTPVNIAECGVNKKMKPNSEDRADLSNRK